MGVKRKAYLKAIVETQDPAKKVYLKLMADVSEEFTNVCAKHINTLGYDTVYNIVITATTAIIAETVYNLCGDDVDLDLLISHIGEKIKGALANSRILTELPCTPKLDS